MTVLKLEPELDTSVLLDERAHQGSRQIDLEDHFAGTMRISSLAQFVTMTNVAEGEVAFVPSASFLSRNRPSRATS
jgi:hypothetical protein